MALTCGGTLVMHRDGTVAFCSSELCGGTCRFPGLPGGRCRHGALHGHSTFVSCTDVVGVGHHCPRCGEPRDAAADGRPGPQEVDLCPRQ